MVNNSLLPVASLHLALCNKTDTVCLKVASLRCRRAILNWSSNTAMVHLCSQAWTSKTLMEDLQPRRLLKRRKRRKSTRRIETRRLLKRMRLSIKRLRTGVLSPLQSRRLKSLSEESKPILKQALRILLMATMVSIICLMILNPMSISGVLIPKI